MTYPVVDVLQNFWQRLRNYIQRALVNTSLTRTRGDQLKFIKATGRKLCFYESGVSTSAAVIAVVDWAIEYP